MNGDDVVFKHSPLGDDLWVSDRRLHVDIFERLTQLSKSRETVQDKRDRGLDFNVDQFGNIDDAYDAGREDGGVELARDLLKEFFGDRKR